MFLSVLFCAILTINSILSPEASASSSFYDVTTEASVTLPRNILSLSTEEKRNFLDSIDNVFSDIDGVLWNMEHVVKGAAAGFKELQNAGKKLTFITNNSVRPMNNYAKRFKELELNTDVNDIIHPAKSIVEYLHSIHFDGLIYIIASEECKNVLRRADFKLIDGPTKIIDETFADLAANVFDREPVRAVIIDFDFNVSIAKLIRANLYLNNPECLLIAGATDMMLPLSKDISIIGPGGFTNILAECSNRKMIVLGKPGADLANLLINRFDIKNTKRALMIGDMLLQDVGFGKECGFQTLIVLSGGCSRKDLETQTNQHLIPDYYAESMEDFVQFMKDMNKSNF